MPSASKPCRHLSPGQSIQSSPENETVSWVTASKRFITGQQWMLWLLAFLVVAFILLATLFPNSVNEWFHRINTMVYSNFGWFYLVFVSAMVLLAIALMLSPLGAMKLGQENEKPTFDNFSWFSMLFCAGMGTGFLFWGGAEPLYHWQFPPFTSETPRLQALALTFFHWSVSPWAIYGLTAVATGYFCFVKRLPMRFSSFINCKQPWQQELLDGFLMLALVFGIAATFGMGVLMIGSGLHHVLGIPQSPLLMVSIVALMTGIFLYSAYRGLQNGIRMLSNGSMVLTLGLLVLFSFLIPKDHLIADFLPSIGHYAKHLPAWSLGIGDFKPVDWPRDWTVKYWSWWLAWAPFVGSFIAVISRGRTIRQVLFGSVIAPSILSIIWFSVMGQAAIAWFSANPGQVFSLKEAQNIWFAILDYYTHSIPLAVFSIIMVGIFVCDSLDSASFTLGCLTQSYFSGKGASQESSQETNDNLLAPNTKQEPNFKHTLIWGGLLASLTCALLLSGGIQLLQEVTPVTVLPFTVILGLALTRFVWLLFKDWQVKKEGSAIIGKSDPDFRRQKNQGQCLESP